MTSFLLISVTASASSLAQPAAIEKPESAESSWAIVGDGASSPTQPKAAALPPPLESPATAPTTATNSTISKGLRDAFDAALRHGETMSIQKELLIQAGESYNQALNSFAPTLSATAGYLHQKTPNASTAPSFLPDQRTSKISLSMPLFRGLRDFAALRQRKLHKEAQVFVLQTAARQLFYDVATAFYNLLALQSDEKNYQAEIEINRKRLSDLQTYLRIGRTRPTELLTLQANISSLEAQLEQIRGQLENAKDVLAFLANWDRSTMIVDDESEFSASSIEQYLEVLEQRADIRSALASAKAASENVPIARGGHLPSLDFVGDNYFQRPGQPDGGPNWSVQLVLSVPIFQGGIVNSQVRQAQSVAHQFELQLTQVRRLANEEVRTLHNSFTADQKQLGKLEQTVGWAKKNYLSQLADYKNGLVTNLEVLTATSTYQNAVRNMDRQLHKLNLDSVILQAAIGKRSEINLVE